MAAYPSEYEFDVVLRDGEVAQVRPIKPSDAEPMQHMFATMGPGSRYFRFFRVKRELTSEELEYFTNLDYRDRMAFVVYQDGVLIGVGRYDRAEDDAASAEVAFAVADSHHGRGIGTQLLQLLTVYGRAHGITGFRAFVLPENVGMMRVFRNSGYALGRTLEEGIYTVDFPVEHSEDAVAREQVREQRAVSASVLPILYPRSVAVVGASRTPGSIGYQSRDVTQDGAADFYRTVELNNMARELQPDILLNNRGGGDMGDFGTPEQHVSAEDAGLSLIHI